MFKISKYKKLFLYTVCVVVIIILGLSAYYFAEHRWKKFEGDSVGGKHYIISYPPSWKVDDKTDSTPALLSLPDCYVGLGGLDTIPNNTDKKYYLSMPKESIQIKNGTMGMLYINEQEEPVDNLAVAIFPEFQLSLLYSNKTKNCVNEFKSILKTLELFDNSYRDSSGEIWKRFSTNNRFNLTLENYQKLEKLGMTPARLEISYPNSWELGTRYYNEVKGYESMENVIISNYLMLSKISPNAESELGYSDMDTPYYFANISLDIGVSDLPLERIVELTQNDSAIKQKITRDKFLGYEAVKVYEKDDLSNKILFKISPSTYFIVRSNINIDTKDAEYKKVLSEVDKVIGSIKFNSK